MADLANANQMKLGWRDTIYMYREKDSIMQY